MFIMSVNTWNDSVLAKIPSYLQLCGNKCMEILPGYRKWRSAMKLNLSSFVIVY